MKKKLMVLFGILMAVLWVFPVFALDAQEVPQALTDAPWYAHVIGVILTVGLPLALNWASKYMAKQREALDASIARDESQGKTIDLERRGKRIGVIVSGETLEVLLEKLPALLPKIKRGELPREDVKMVLDAVWTKMRDTSDPDVQVAIGDLKASAKLATSAALEKWIKNEALASLVGHLTNLLGEKAADMVLGGTDPN